MSRPSRITIDPQLLRQLKGARNQRSVGAVFTLRGDERGATLSPKETKAVVKRMLDRIGRQTKSKPKDVNVFSNIQSFALEAPVEFVKTLLEQPEIDSAVANLQSEDMLINPVDS